MPEQGEQRTAAEWSFCRTNRREFRTARSAAVRCAHFLLSQEFARSPDAVSVSSLFFLFFLLNNS